MDTFVEDIMYYIMILLVTILMSIGVIYLYLKTEIPIEYRLFIVLFMIFGLSLLTFFVYFLFPIAIIHILSFLA